MTKTLTDADRRSIILQSNIKLASMPAAPFFFEEPISIGKVEIGASVTFGMHSYMNSGFVRGGAEIGRYCSIGRDVTIGTGTHDIDGLSTSPALAPSRNVIKYADQSRRKTVVIGHDVWIGDKALIMTGVTVGHGAVIAASAVVTKDVEPYSIVVGVPAAQARNRPFRFSEEVRQNLLASRWWDIPLDQLSSAPKDDPDDFLQWLEDQAGSHDRIEFGRDLKQI